VAEGEIGRCGVDAEVDAERASFGEALPQIALHGAGHTLVAVDDAAHQELYLLINR
jgi:hypothetical protein